MQMRNVTQATMPEVVLNDEQVPESAANINWQELYREFYRSRFYTAQDFLRHKLGTKIALSGYVRRQTTGWAAEKKGTKKKINDLAEKRIKQLKEEELVKAKKLYIIEMRDRIVEDAQALNHKELASNLRAIKTELGEPSIITKQNIVEEPLDDDEAFNRLMGIYEKDTAANTAGKRSKAPKRKRAADAKVVARKSK